MTKRGESLKSSFRQCLEKNRINGKVNNYSETSVKRTFRTFPRVRLVEGVRLIEVCKNCAMFVND